VNINLKVTKVETMEKIGSCLIILLSVVFLGANLSVATSLEANQEEGLSHKLGAIAQELVLLPARVCNAIAVKSLASLIGLIQDLKRASLSDSVQKRTYHVLEKTFQEILPLTASVSPYFYGSIKAARSCYVREKLSSIPYHLLKLSLALYVIHVGDSLLGYAYEPLENVHEESRHNKQNAQKYSLIHAGNNNFVLIPMAER